MHYHLKTASTAALLIDGQFVQHHRECVRQNVAKNLKNLFAILVADRTKLRMLYEITSVTNVGKIHVSSVPPVNMQRKSRAI